MVYIVAGIKNDGSSYHFFHRPTGAYDAGKRKRRTPEEGEDKFGNWQKTGKARAISEDGKELGFKKVMVFYDTNAAKRNWVMHQYYLGLQKEGKEEEYVVSKIFYQKQMRQCRSIGVQDNGEKKGNLLEETEGPDSLPQQLKISKTVMNVSSPREEHNMISISNKTMPCAASSGNMFAPPSVEMQKSLLLQEFETNMTGIDISSSGKFLVPSVSGDPYLTLQHKGFENSETMMDVPLLGETFPHPVCGEMPLNSQFGTDEAGKGASLPREVPCAPALIEVGLKAPHKGLFQQLTEDTKTMWNTSFPQTVPAIVEVSFSVFQSA